MEDNYQTTNFAASSSSPSPSVMPLKKYDVFLSFRGEDTRDNFTSHLYDALDQAKVETYIDYRLEKGDEISQALIKAIQDSLVSVVIFSENYASSKWCLDEISKILECKRDHGQIVIPVFYKVDPSDVRNQRGSYKEAFAKHEQDLNNSDDDKLQKWRLALRDAANLAGWDSCTYRNESDFIKDIVKDVLQKLNITIGIEGNYAGIESLLELGSTEVVRVIGIWGMGGIGKTTLARALYDKLSIQFEGHCFLKSVREQSQKNGLDALRTILFSELLREENLHIESPYVMRRLARKKVLIVLDDVPTSKQLKDLIGVCNLAPGSRVIVTTRDKHIFSQENGIYEVKGLNNHDSLQLFCLNAFGGETPKQGYEELSESVIAYCKGNPLALIVLGARLQSRGKDGWESELRKLRKIPDADIHDVLKLSFDDLDPDQKDIFLDIACFFKGELRSYVTSLLDAFDFFPVSGIEDLINKSLITISVSDRIEMHDLIQEMGQNVVRQDTIKHPGRRSRLWDPEEVYDVLKNNKGTEAVECIVLDMSKIKDLPLKFNSFSKMTEIRLLKLHSSEWWSEGCKISLPDGLESLSDKLNHLEWHRCCLESLPSTFCAEKLVKLVMPHSHLKKLWDGVQDLAKLKEIDLTFSNDLVELPDLSMATNLEVLSLFGCKSLRQVHPSIFSLPKLKNLNLKDCTKIESLETEVHLKSLCELTLSGCSSLMKFSVFSEDLRTLELQGTSIHELPSSIWRCEKLESLNLSGCINVEMLSPSIKNLLKLEKLILDNCSKLVSLPELPPSLERFSAINLRALPDIKNLLKLRQVRLDNCSKLVSLPDLPPSLHMLSAINCTSLHTDITQLVPVVNRATFVVPTYVIVPGAQVPDMFTFRSEGDSITVTQLPQSGLSGFICCLILSYIPPDCKQGNLKCCISKHSSRTRSNLGFWVDHFISDHVLLFYMDIKDWIISQKSRACDLDYSISFELCLDRVKRMYNELGRIERCGVCPVYVSQE